MNAEDNSFPRLECPALDTYRYEYLRTINTSTSGSRTLPTYFFALDLHQCANLLPRLIGSIVESMRFLGPENCALSIVEGRSDDGTFEILKVLRPEIEGIGATYFFNSSDLEPGAPNQDRIWTLAELRNQALEPLIRRPDRYSPDTTIVFLNDVSICTQDILELVHQRFYQKADMTCAMDWVYVGQDPTFYDVWIARGMTGDSFFNIPEDGNWNSAWNLFWNDPKAQELLYAHKPFQVFSCWNGATAFTARPILEQKIRFRGPTKNECYQGEPKLFCKDMWHWGYGKIAVVPTINLEYSDDAARKIKALRGYVSDWVNKDGDDDDPSMLIEWQTSPPALVKCMPSYSDQSWRAWDEAL
jgi:alpha-1,3-mannosyltransferase